MYLIVQTSKCVKCFIEISAELSEPIVLLPCKHMVHFEYIDNKRKLCPGCLTTYELEKEGGTNKSRYCSQLFLLWKNPIKASCYIIAKKPVTVSVYKAK